MQADFTAPASPDNITISHTGSGPKAISGSNVVVSFDTETDSTVSGTIDSQAAVGDVSGTSGTLTLTLTGTETAGSDLTFSFVITDENGNAASAETAVKGDGADSAVQADFTAPASPDNITISHTGSGPKAISGSNVVVSFDTETDSTVSGTIDSQAAVGDVSGTSGTLTLTLTGTETAGSDLTFSFVITDENGNAASAETAVKGDGADSAVQADFTAPASPDNITISHTGSGPKAISGSNVVVSFDTETDSTVSGTIDSQAAVGDVSGTSGTLTLTLTGTETAGSDLTFSFVITDENGNAASAETAVKGDGADSAVQADFTAPASPDNITISHTGSGPKAISGSNVVVSFDTETDSTVSGTIDSQAAVGDVSGTSGTLTLTLTGTETAGSDLTFSFVITDENGNAASAETAVKGDGADSAVQADFTAPASPDNITISHTGSGPKAISGSNVVVSFDTETDSTVSGTIDSQAAVGDVSGTSGTLTLTLTGTETAGSDLTFSFVITDENGNAASAETAVKGDGADSAVQADFTAPASPDNITISHTGSGPKAISGSNVVVSFDTETDSTVSGTIDSQAAVENVSGTSGTLTLTLNGTETAGSDLTFSFVITDENGNAASAETAVKGDGADSAVQADFTAPASPDNITISHTGSGPKAISGSNVVVSFDTETDSTVSGTIDSQAAVGDVSGTSGTLTLTLTGTETAGSDLTFSFVITDENGNAASAETAVKGDGADSAVQADFTAPASPDNITISHTGSGPRQYQALTLLYHLIQRLTLLYLVPLTAKLQLVTYLVHLVL